MTVTQQMPECEKVICDGRATISSESTKASEIIEGFNRTEEGEETRERQAQGKMGKERTAFLNAQTKGAGNSTSRPGRFADNRMDFLTEGRDVVVARAEQKKGTREGQQRKWMDRMLEEEQRRKNVIRDLPPSGGSSVEQELRRATAECTERSRMLSQTREKYQILKDEFESFQTLLGIRSQRELRRASSVSSTQELIGGEDESLQQERDDMRNRLESLIGVEKELNKTKELLSKMEEELISCQMVVRMLQCEGEDLNNREKVTVQEREAARSEAEGLRADLESTQRNAQELEVRADKLAGELAVVSGNLEERAAQQGRQAESEKVKAAKEASERLEKITLELEVSEKKMHYKIFDYETKCAELSVAEGEIEKRDQEVIRLEIQNFEGKKELKNLESRLDVATQSAKELDLTLKSLQSNKDEIESEAESLREKLATVEGDAARNDVRWLELETENQTLVDELSTADGRVLNVMTEIHNLRACWSTAKDEVKDLRQQMQESSDQKEVELRELNKTLVDKIEELEATRLILCSEEAKLKTAEGNVLEEKQASRFLSRRAEGLMGDIEGLRCELKASKAQEVSIARDLELARVLCQQQASELDALLSISRQQEELRRRPRSARSQLIKEDCDFVELNIVYTNRESAECINDDNSPPGEVVHVSRDLCGVGLGGRSLDVAADRRASLSDFIAHINSVQADLRRREDTLLKKIERKKDLERSLQEREKLLVEKLAKMRSKETRLFDVMKTLRSREEELDHVQQTFSSLGEKYNQLMQSRKSEGSGK